MGIIEASAMKRFDPQLRDIELPLKGSYYPLGFRLDIATNSSHVIEAARESWGLSRQEFDSEPIEFRVVVEEAGGLAPPPTFRVQRHLFCVVSDAHNFAIADRQAWFASIWVSQKTAAHHAWLRWFYIEALAYHLLSQRYLVAAHAACIARQGRGVLLCGQSGSGKSTLSFACARAGWTYVADDCIWLLPDSTHPVGIGAPQRARFRHDASGIFPELAGYGASARPNGKLSLEVSMADFPHLHTAPRCLIGSLVSLDRRSSGAPHCEAIPAREITDGLMNDIPTYGPDVDAMHERAIRGLESLPAWRLRYSSVDDGVALLEETFRK